jgi:ATP-binding cassette subfamily B protein
MSLAGIVLGCGAGGLVHVASLLGWLGFAAWLGVRFWACLRDWTRARLEMTNDVVERMAGHRTRLAQEVPARRHEGEDEALDNYLALSLKLDRASLALQALVPRGWWILGVLGMAPAFIFGGTSLGALAVGIGGLLLGLQAFRHLADGLERTLAALVGWRSVKPFWDAAARREPLGEPEFALADSTARVGEIGEHPPAPLLDLREVTFRHRTRAEPVLKGVDLQVYAGDKILLEGPSGGGKSTLASLLSGARNVGSGLILLRGLDKEVVGKEAWRRKVVLVPQFHENHVFLGSFAFNALMGRRWPPSATDLSDAERTCRALGLGPLLARMPGGLLQNVGETGWQLSHGERSRLYIARALLQGAEVMILDESFAALDPETLRGNLSYVLENTSTLVVIAHP